MMAEIEEAVAFLRPSLGSPPLRENYAREVSQICRDWLRTRKRDLAVSAAAKKIGHAGLAYLATEADWAAILKHGRHAARDAVIALATSSGEDDLADTLDDYQL